MSSNLTLSAQTKNMIKKGGDMTYLRGLVRVSFLVLFFIGSIGSSVWAAEQTASAQDKETAKQALLKVFEAEIKQTPALKDFLMDQNQAPLKSALADLQAKRDGGGLTGLTSWIQKGKKWYIVATGITDYIPPTAEERQIVQQALQTVFSEEIKHYPSVKEFVLDESKRTFKHALVDLRAERDGGGLTGVTSWISKVDKTRKIDNKGWYLSYCGITEFMKTATPAPPPPPPDKKIPVIDNIHPDEAAPGMEVYIFGENFDGFQTAYYDNAVMECKYRTPTEIECYIPDDIKANGTIKVVTDRGEAVFGKQFGAHIDPEITRIKADPARPSVDSNTYVGDTLTIEGKNFVNVKEVTFANNDYVLLASKATSVQTISRTELKVIVPSMTAGTYALKVKTNAGEAKGGNMKILARPVPTISRIPATVNTEADFIVQGTNFFTRVGQNLRTETSVMFVSGGAKVPAQGVKLVSEQEMWVKAPKTKGAYSLEIKTPWGSVVHPIGVETRTPLAMTSISPEGRRLGNRAIIEGQGFEDIETIEVGGVKIKYNLNSTTSITLIGVAWGIDEWSKNFASVRIKTKWGEASKALISPKESVIYNAEGHEEKCFPAVGNACAGFGREATKGSTNPVWGLIAAGCSEEKEGKRKCVIVPGSIKHDNCCLRHPLGKRCGGTFPDGRKAEGAMNFENVDNPGDLIDGPNDGNCHQEWDDAAWDVKNRRGWDQEFGSDDLADLTPVASPNNRYSGGEVKDSARYCAPNTASISARHGQGWCCSGYGKQYWALGVEDWIICEPQSGGRSVQGVGKRGRIQADPPLAPKPEISQLLRVGLLPEKKVYTLSIDKPSSGKIISEDKKINCGTSPCYAEYKEGEKVTLKAAPDSDYKLTGWTGACSGKELQCALSMTENKKVGATFVYEKPMSTAIPAASAKKPDNIESAGNDIKPANAEGTRSAIPEESPVPVAAPVEKETPSTGQPCNPYVPKYQQPGCVEQAAQEKRSPYDGLPCPSDENIPGYAKIGCIPN